MAISLDDLPRDEGGMPGGMWRAILKDAISDSFFNTTFENGVSGPMLGRMLFRLVSNMLVDGAWRVEGDTCEIGDLSRFQPATTVKVPVKLLEEAKAIAAAQLDVTIETVEPVIASPVAAQEFPATMSDLAKLDEREARVVAEKLGNLDQSWKLPRLRRFISEELGLS
jgi:hypothetical protein